MRPPLSRRLGIGLAALALSASWVQATSAQAETAATATNVQEVAVPSAQGPAEGTTQQLLAALPSKQASFDMAGVTWGSIPADATVQIRVQNAKGWGEWETLERTKVAPSEGTRQGTEPLWVGDSTAAEARILGTAGQGVQDVKLALINSKELAQDAALSSTTSQVSAARAMTASVTGYTYATKPSIISRAQWGADESLRSYNAGCGTPSFDSTIKGVVVHHSAGSNSYTATESASIVRGYYAYHTKTKGWCDIGYNVLVDRYGKIFEGRFGGLDMAVRGAHAGPGNPNTLGISVMMNSETAMQTPESMAAVEKVLAWKLAGNYRDPNTTFSSNSDWGTKTVNRIMMHKDVMSTACPGKNIIAYMPTMRSRVTSLMGNWKTPIYKAWMSNGGESGRLGSPYIMERAVTGGRLTDFTRGSGYQYGGGNAYIIGSGIDAKYKALGRTTSWLGWPTSNEIAGTLTGQVFVNFQKGRIYHSSAGTFGVNMGVRTWLDADSRRISQLGSPTSDPVTTSSTTGYQDFQNGRLSWNGTTFSFKKAFMATPGDVTGDGRADLVTISQWGTVFWRETSSSLVSGPATQGTSLGTALNWSQQVPDLNGDGHNELIGRKSDGTMWLWDGRGRGQYVNGRRVGTGWSAFRELNVVPDMTGDRLPEVIGIGGDRNLYRYSLLRTGAFVTGVRIGQNWGGISQLTSVGDFRRVGVTDILAITPDGKLLDYFGSPTGALSGSKQVGQGWLGMSDIRSAGDIDRDTHWDLVGLHTNGNVYAYLNRGGSWNQLSTPWATGITQLMA